MRDRSLPNGFRRNLPLLAILAIVIAGAPLTPLAAQSQKPDWQAAAGGRMSFDSATVIPNKAGTRAPTISNFPLGPGDVYVPNGGQFRAMGFSLSGYIVFAYKLSSSQEEYLLSHLLKWATTDRFDIQAKAHGNPTKDQMRLMVQSLLADRFRLSAHYETREVPVFGLVLDQPGKLGPLLQRHAEQFPCTTDARTPSPAPTAQPELHDSRFPIACSGIVRMPPSAAGRVRSGARNVSIELIADSMMDAPGVDRPVLDKTGLTGNFDFAAEYSPQASASSVSVNPRGNLPGPTFLQAIKEQLGFKLEPQTGLLDYLVVDYVEELRSY
jgi:uncharacterized protein (TIGR03435 family)